MTFFSARYAVRAGFSARAAMLAACLAVSGCAVKLHGGQSTGMSATATSSQLAGSTRFSGGKASFSSGGPVSSPARGGHVSLGKGPTAVLLIGLMIADAVNYFGSKAGFTAMPEPRTDSILETCSCYQKPVNSE